MIILESLNRIQVLEYRLSSGQSLVSVLEYSSLDVGPNTSVEGSVRNECRTATRHVTLSFTADDQIRSLALSQNDMILHPTPAYSVFKFVTWLWDTEIYLLEVAMVTGYIERECKI